MLHLDKIFREAEIKNLRIEDGKPYHRSSFPSWLPK